MSLPFPIFPIVIISPNHHNAACPIGMRLKLGGLIYRACGDWNIFSYVFATCSFSIRYVCSRRSLLFPLRPWFPSHLRHMFVFFANVPFDAAISRGNTILPSWLAYQEIVLYAEVLQSSYITLQSLDWSAKLKRGLSWQYLQIRKESRNVRFVRDFNNL